MTASVKYDIAMDIKLLSKYRTELMGFSMLMVMFFHTIGGLPVKALYSVKPFICFDFGVEFFIVLSAIGCTYSLDRNKDTIGFFKRRFKRIIPAFVVVVVLDFIVNDLLLEGNADLFDFFRKLFFMNFWKGDISFWFILYILTCYMITPFVYSRADSKILLGLIGIGTIALFFYGFNHGCPQNVLLYRFPIYFIALLWCNYAMKNNTQLNFFYLGILTLAVYAMLIMFISYPYKYLLYMAASIPCLLFIAMVVDKCNRHVQSILSFVGGISLELYLIHEKCLGISDMISTNIAFRIVFSFTLGILLSYLLHFCLTRRNKQLKMTNR